MPNILLKSPWIIDIIPNSLDEKYFPTAINYTVGQIDVFCIFEPPQIDHDSQQTQYIVFIIYLGPKQDII